MSDQTSPCIHIRGAWSGPVGSLEREFLGAVTDSEVGTFSAGDPVTVTYQAAPTRTPGPQEHGTYTLHAEDTVLMLASFTCPAALAGGKQALDDTQEADWAAIPAQHSP